MESSRSVQELLRVNEERTASHKARLEQDNRISTLKLELARLRAKHTVPLTEPAAPLIAGSDAVADDAQAAKRGDLGLAGACAGVAVAHAGASGGLSGTRVSVPPSGDGEVELQLQLQALRDAGVAGASPAKSPEPTPHASRGKQGVGCPAPCAIFFRPTVHGGSTGLGAAESDAHIAVSTQALDGLKARVSKYTRENVNNGLTECAKIFNGCLIHPSANVFALPVNTSLFPDYLDHIQQPMDYTKIVSNLTSDVYTDHHQLMFDIELVFRNCMRYTPDVTNNVHIAANALLTWFKSRTTGSGPENYMLRYDTGVAARRGQVRVAGRPRDDDTVPVRQNAERAVVNATQVVDQVRAFGRRAREDSEISDDDAPRPQRRRTGPAPARPTPATARAAPSDRAPMSFERKRQLNVGLSNLPIARQARVLQILGDQVGGQADEVEIDMDQMDNTTLWRLFDYVFSVSRQVAMGITHDELVVVARAAAPVAAPPPIAAPPPVTVAMPVSSSSDSDSSDTDSSDDDDDKPAAAVPEATATAIISDVAVRTEVTIQNASSWANFAAQGAADAGGNGTAAAGDGAIPDALWAEFARKVAEKDARDAAVAKAEAAAKAAAEVAETAAKAAADAAEAAAKAAAEAAEALKEAARERARAELANVPQTVNLDEQRSVMEEMGVGEGGYGGGFRMPDFPGM
jgi:hypothetical protein